MINRTLADLGNMNQGGTEVKNKQGIGSMVISWFHTRYDSTDHTMTIQLLSGGHTGNDIKY